MSEIREAIDRLGAEYTLPGDAFHGVVARRERKRRNQRIRAGSLGLADDRSQDLGIFAPVSGRILYVEDGIWAAHRDAGLWAVDPNGPSDTVEGPSVSDDVASTLVPLNLEEAPRRWSNGEGLEPLGWSSDGTKLLVTHWKHFEGTYYVHHADGTETRVPNQVPSIGGAAAAISPDGSSVVFDEEGLTIVDVESGRTVKLPSSADGVPGGGLTFSPDGTRIAYTSEDAVWVVNTEGSDAHKIVANETTRSLVGWFSGMQWSPAGDRIAIGLGDYPAIYTFAPDGSDFTKVIAGGVSPYWSPDGSQIAYVVSGGSHGRHGLAIADADGSNVREFGFGASGPWHPDAP